MCFTVTYGNTGSSFHYPCYYESGLSITIDGHTQLEAIMGQDVNGDCGCSYEEEDCCAEHAHFESATTCTVQNAVCAVGLSPGVRIRFETKCDWDSLDYGGNFAELMSRLGEGTCSAGLLTI